jgi:phage terminase large subunit-like protein
VVREALKYPGTEWGVASPTSNELLGVIFNGSSGIRAQLRPGEESYFNINRTELRLSNGSCIFGFSIAEPNRIRGRNLSGLLIDEPVAASNTIDEFWEETGRFAVRKGESKIVITTTPKSINFLRKLVAKIDDNPRFHVTRGTMYENPFLSQEIIEEYRQEYEGTRTGRQELEGELLGDVEGALFNRDELDRARISEGDPRYPEFFTEIAIGVDPAMTSQERSDESGIVVVASAEGDDGRDHAYVLADYSMRGKPGDVMVKVAQAFYAHDADCVYYESNMGGDWIRHALKQVDDNIPCREAFSSRGKIMRSQPVSNLAQQGRVHLTAPLSILVDQLCVLAPNAKSTEHDDRADAMLHAIWGLKLVSYGSFINSYGLVNCDNCGKPYKKQHAACVNCGHVRKAEKTQEPRPSRGSWSDAYMHVCRKCGTKYPKHQECTNCSMSAQLYLAQVAALSSGGNNNPSVYTGKNWFTGRKV